MQIKFIIGVSSVCSIITAMALYLPSRFPIHGFEISAIFFGLGIGLIIRRMKVVSIEDFFRLWGMASMIFFVFNIVIEVLVYQPWHLFSLEGHRVNIYELRSVYSSALTVYFAAISLMATLVPIIFSSHLWKNFRMTRRSNTI